jgi:hypothetical protein
MAATNTPINARPSATAALRTRLMTAILAAAGAPLIQVTLATGRAITESISGAATVVL